MSKKTTLPTLQNASRKDLPALVDGSDALASWMEAYFRLKVTTLASSQSVQRRDLTLQKQLEQDGSRRWNNRTVNRILAHLETFARWVHQHRPFPDGMIWTHFF